MSLTLAKICSRTHLQPWIQEKAGIEHGLMNSIIFVTMLLYTMFSTFNYCAFIFLLLYAYLNANTALFVAHTLLGW